MEKAISPRKQKRYDRIRSRLLGPHDIRYRGPLSYRYLRIIAWLSLAIGQILVINALGEKLFKWDALSPIGASVIQYFSSFSTPFFIIASFGLVLSNHQKYKNFLVTFGLGFLGLGLGLSIFYLRYIQGLVISMGAEGSIFADAVDTTFSNKMHVNVFADLFMFVLFCYFINTKPKKVFIGKKLIIFRLFAIIPILYAVLCYLLRTFSYLNYFELSIYFIPFMTTKSPVIFALFIIAALWIKNREKLFLKIGATKEEYHHFLTTNKNSLSFSITLSILCGAAFLFEILVMFGFIIYCAAKDYPVEAFAFYLTIYGVGDSFVMIIAIPFIMLYSYTRTHKNKMIDYIIPVVGVALTAFVYLEGTYQLLQRFLHP